MHKLPVLPPSRCRQPSSLSAAATDQALIAYPHLYDQRVVYRNSFYVQRGFSTPAKAINSIYQSGSTDSSTHHKIKQYVVRALAMKRVILLYPDCQAPHLDLCHSFLSHAHHLLLLHIIGRHYQQPAV
jgi:hypothetical protein